MRQNDWILAAEVLEVQALQRLIDQARAELSRRDERGGVTISNVQTQGGDYAEGEIRK